ncbi:unnamed protein product [Eruca vesicaria subsp. sativa]|uniref:J domain-containing protein n=1 Tax=Eruca vesicaria subsp. sativa TaxID=29727 RepID=A0ABC8JXR3_ERUVS|nr:unnamed protein product [Eruca vesicaria subsp. sativa]
MECNKDEAKRAMVIAEKKLSENDYVGAKKFLTKAQNLYPNLDGLNQVSMMIHVYISAENKINGGKESDLYEVLGVDPLADDEALRKQYKKLALLLHPDKNKCQGAEGAFKLVSNAWTLLSDKAKRIAYDQRRKLSTGMQKPPAANQHNKPPGSSNVHPNANGRSNHPNASGPQRPPPYAPKPASASTNQSANTRSNQPASGPQRPPQNPSKPASTSTNQSASRNGVNPSANTRSNQPANGPQRPHYAPKPASSSGNPNAGRDGVHPSGNTTSGPQKQPNSHKPASSSANPSANTRSNKPAPGPAPGPVNSSKQMFWTTCNGCKTRSECRKDLYLNKTMRCQNCGQSYIATENNPWDFHVNNLNRALAFIRQRQQQQRINGAQNQATNRNTNGASSSSSSPSFGATKNHPWESYVTQLKYTLSLVVQRQQEWITQNQAANNNTSTSSQYVGATPQDAFALQQVHSTLSSLLQKWNAVRNINGTPSVSATGKVPHASVVRPVNVSSSSPQQQQGSGKSQTTNTYKNGASSSPYVGATATTLPGSFVWPGVNLSSQQQCGAQNTTSSGPNYPSSTSPSVGATMKTPPGSFVWPGSNFSSSPQQQQQWSGKNTSGGGTYFPSSSSGSVHHKCSVSVPSNSGNAASQAQERSKRGLEDSQETVSGIESILKKMRKDVV